MGKEKFVYNSQTLRYEKVRESLTTKVLRIFAFICAAAFTAFLFTLVLHNYFPSPKEKMLMKEIEAMKVQYHDLSNTIDMLTEELRNIQDRDAYAHRMVFGMEPIDQGVWEGGIGGHEQFEEYKQFKHSGELMTNLRQKTERLKRQMVIQSKSLDTIIQLASQKEQMLASIPSIKPISNDKLKRHIKFLSGFGRRIHPILKVPKFHYGIDFTAPTGTPIQATGAGLVTRADFSPTFGYVVEIDHGYDYKTLYAHMKKFSVKKGEKVVRGQTIGIVGSTGRSTAPHCHYEIHFKGQPINPIGHCLDGLSPEEYEQLVTAAETVNQSLDYAHGDD